MAEIDYGRLDAIEAMLGGRAAITKAYQAGNKPTGKRQTLMGDGQGNVGWDGVPRIVRCPFAYNTPGILTGASLWTPAIGDLLLECWIEVATAWNGTTPQADVGRFLDSGYNYGWWGNSGSPVGLDIADSTEAFLDYGVLTSGGEAPDASSSSLLSHVVEEGIRASSGNTAHANVPRTLPAKFVTADPVRVCVSQDGTTTGSSPGATQGAGAVYFMVATPAST